MVKKGKKKTQINKVEKINLGTLNKKGGNSLSIKL